jgi:hypothetical protein
MFSIMAVIIRNDEWDLADLSCAKRGDCNTRCTRICHNDDTCEVKIEMDHCSCSGKKVRMEETQFFNISTSKRLSKAGIPSMDGLCKGCSKYCTNWTNRGQQLEDKKRIKPWKPMKTMGCSTSKDLKNKKHKKKASRTKRLDYNPKISTFKKEVTV